MKGRADIGRTHKSLSASTMTKLEGQQRIISIDEAMTERMAPVRRPGNGPMPTRGPCALRACCTPAQARRRRRRGRQKSPPTRGCSRTKSRSRPRWPRTPGQTPAGAAGAPRPTWGGGSRPYSPMPEAADEHLVSEATSGSGTAELRRGVLCEERVHLVHDRLRRGLVSRRRPVLRQEAAHPRGACLPGNSLSHNGHVVMTSCRPCAYLLYWMPSFSIRALKP